MNTKRFFFVMIGVVVLLSLLSVGGVVLGNARLTTQSKRLVDLKLENAVLEDQRTALVRAKRDINEHKTREAIAKQIVPQEKDQARTVREIVRFAQESEVSLGSVSFPASTLGSEQRSSSSSSRSTRSRSRERQAPAGSQLEPAENISGVYRMEITVNSDQPVEYARLIAFLRRLEANRRTSQVKSLTVNPESENRNLVTFSFVVNVYIKPEKAS